MSEDLCIAAACVIGPALFFLLGWRARGQRETGRIRQEGMPRLYLPAPRTSWRPQPQSPCDPWRPDGIETITCDRRP